MLMRFVSFVIYFNVRTGYISELDNSVGPPLSLFIVPSSRMGSNHGCRKQTDDIEFFPVTGLSPRDNLVMSCFRCMDRRLISLFNNNRSSLAYALGYWYEQVGLLIQANIDPNTIQYIYCNA